METTTNEWVNQDPFCLCLLSSSRFPETKEIKCYGFHVQGLSVAQLNSSKYLEAFEDLETLCVARNQFPELLITLENTSLVLYPLSRPSSSSPPLNEEEEKSMMDWAKKLRVTHRSSLLSRLKMIFSLENIVLTEDAYHTLNVLSRRQSPSSS